MEDSKGMEPGVTFNQPSCSNRVEDLPEQMICPIVPMGSPITDQAIDFTICDINSADDVRQAMKTITDVHKMLTSPSPTPKDSTQPDEATKRKTSGGPNQALPPKGQSTRPGQIMFKKRQRPEQNRGRKGRPLGRVNKAQLGEDFYVGKLSNYVRRSFTDG